MSDGDMGLLDAIADGSQVNQANLPSAPKKPHLPVVVEEREPEEDLKLAKSTVREVMEIGMEVLKDTQQLVRMSDDPRITRTVPSLLKEIVDASKTLTEMSGYSKNPKGKGKTDDIGSGNLEQNNTTVNNTTIFSGSPAELQKMMDSGDDTIIDVTPETDDANS